MKGLLERLGRAILLALVRLAFGPAPRPPPPVDPGAVRRVLVVRTDTRVGNVLLTTPLLRALRRGLQGARVDFLVASGKEGLVEGLADRVLAFRKQDFFRAPWRFWALIRKLRRARYDAVIEAGHWHAFSFTSLWLARATRAPVRVGHARGLSDRFLTHEVTKDPGILREVPSKLELLRPLGVAPAGEALETTVDRAPEVAARAEAIVRSVGASPVAALNPGARKADHRWPPEAFGAMAARLRERCGAASLVLWGPGEEPLARAVVEASGGAATMAPPTDLALLAGVFRRAAVVVTNDTGPMHLAAAAGAPTVAVLLAPDGERWCHAGPFEGVAVSGGGGDGVEKVAEAAARLVRAGRCAS